MAMYEFSQEARQILEASAVASAILQIDATGYHVLLVSDGACKLFGLDRPALITYLNNKSYGKMHPGDAGRLLEASRSLATEDELSVTVRMSLRGDNQYHPIFFKASAYYTPEGTRLIQMTYIDIDAATDTGAAWSSSYQKRQDNRFFLDEVTGLPNSNHFREFAGGTLKSILDEGETPVLVLFDIHGMYFYNDSFGYEAGDELLKRTGAIIRSAFPSFFCVRYLEDHFVVILPKDKLGDRVDEVRARVRAYADGDSLDIEAGIYEYLDPAESCASALDKARRAVDSIHDKPDEYLCWYSAEVEDRYSRQNYVLSHYHEAIEQGWIKVYYQPLVSTLSGEVSHCEALARWIDPTLGLLSPASFIGVLEDSHKVWEVDLEIIRQVARDVREARKAGRFFPPLSVNVSRYDLAVPGFHELINDILARYGVGHDEIAIEITESALVEHEEFIGQHVQRFHEDGYQVWLDDFGSGYSSFTALQNFDFDLLKIDMQFLRKANMRTPQILSGIVDLTKRLDIRSVTEGVETEKQAEFLRQIGCGLLQGYYYSKPIPGDEFFDQISELGLTIESPDDRRFYDELLRVNVLDAYHPLPAAESVRSDGDKSISIMVEEDGVFRVIYMDVAGLNRLQRRGVSSLEQFNEAVNAGNPVIYETMRDCCAGLDEIGDTAVRDVDTPPDHGTAEGQADRERRTSPRLYRQFPGDGSGGIGSLPGLSGSACPRVKPLSFYAACVAAAIWRT